MGTLRLRKLADKSEDAVRAHPMEHPDKWPLAGIDLVDQGGKSADPPSECRVPTSLVDKGRAEGWIEVEGEQVHHRPGGPPDDLWRVTHTFKHYDAIVLKTHDGRDDVRYKVLHQPDKYLDTTEYTDLEPTPHTTAKEDAASVTDEHYAAGHTRVDWFYDLKLES